MRTRYELNDGWKFSDFFDEAMTAPDFDDQAMKAVRLPHTVRETPFDYFDESIYQMVSCYRKRFTVPEEWKGKKVVLTFEGAAHEATVYWNGEAVTTHSCGYTSFTVDLTDRLNYGADAVIAVRLDSRESLNIPPFGFVIDYMTYGGLYRGVSIEVSDRTRLADVFLRTEGTPVAPRLVTEIETENPDGRNVFVRQLLLETSSGESPEEAEGSVLTPRLLGTFYPDAIKRAGNAKAEFRCDVSHIRLWDVDRPDLYMIRTELLDAASLEVVDRVDIRYGFRFAEFRTDGFYLNDKKLRIVGLDRHQSYPYVGYAMPASAQETDAAILKNELGLNAVRTSHYPNAHSFIGACDRLGLLVFTEIPGWQHIGDDAWKAQAVRNVEEMVREYRNHPSIILWGVRINESQDDDALYAKTNETAHRLDPSRQTGGVRFLKKSHLLEDVYTYNDFVHNGTNAGCEPKKNVTSDVSKPYLITEYNGHMFPTKTFDDEEHRRDHLLRHARVLNDVAGEEDIAGSFGWVFADYNTHRDFGSGDRICYHGVLDMFRNAKPAASVYAVRGKENVLEVSSSMDIGEHPASNRGVVWIVTNADSVRMYKNDRLLKEYFPKDSPYKNLAHGPIAVDDLVGDALIEGEHFKPAQAAAVKDLMNYSALYGWDKLPPKIMAKAAKCMALYHMTMADAVRLYNKYVGDWGGSATVYRFDAVKDGKVVKTVRKCPFTKVFLEVRPDRTDLVERETYDVASLRIRAVDENGNLLPYFNEPVSVIPEGPIEVVGPSMFSLKGGLGGVYVRSKPGKAGEPALFLSTAQTPPVRVRFTVSVADLDRL